MGKIKLTESDLKTIIRESVTNILSNLKESYEPDATPEQKAEAEEILSDSDSLDWDYEIEDWDGGYATAFGYAEVEGKYGTYTFHSSGRYEPADGYIVDEIEGWEVE